MTSETRPRTFVVIQLNGGNDYLNTIVPYGNGLYYDYRPTVQIEADTVLPIDDNFGFNPTLGPIKELWDEGKVGIINGIGYPEPNRSHFRSMDIWHTAEPEKIGTEGWLGRTIRDLDPYKENVLTGINFGLGLPRAMGCKDVPVASVGNLETYGLFPDVREEQTREFALEAFSRMYGAMGRGDVIDHLAQTGTDAQKGADILRTAPGKYSSSVEYGPASIAQNLKGVAQVLFADLGTRIYFTQHTSFDTHGGELSAHAKLWRDVAGAVSDFYADLKEHGRENDVVILAYSEFGRRIQDNGSGTDHGSGGVAFVIGDPVKGGMYGEYPSLKEEDQLNGDLHFNNDFRSTYSTILDQWLRLDAVPIVNGQFEQFDFFKNI